MANWKLTIDLNLVIPSDNTISFKEFKRIIIPRLEKYISIISEKFNENISMAFEDYVMYLKDSENVEEWDQNMLSLYDFADTHLIWIETNWDDIDIINDEDNTLEEYNDEELDINDEY